jgi:hypothetical protein
MMMMMMMMMKNPLPVPPPPLPTPPALLCFEVPRLLGPLNCQQCSPLAHHAVAKALRQLVFALLWQPVTEHNFFNSFVYFWSPLGLGWWFIFWGGGGGYCQKLLLCVMLNFGCSVDHRLWNHTVSAVEIIWCQIIWGWWPCLGKLKGLEW